ncbi:hypothetical protein CLU79DRAFT_837554 [Phycomyces nitens]|nr:hypothetical protein CLU79DRAFT_837554 [Phycomyces nitens]
MSSIPSPVRHPSLIPRSKIPASRLSRPVSTRPTRIPIKPANYARLSTTTTNIPRPTHLPVFAKRLSRTPSPSVPKPIPSKSRVPTVVNAAPKPATIIKRPLGQKDALEKERQKNDEQRKCIELQAAQITQLTAQLKTHKDQHNYTLEVVTQLRQELEAQKELQRQLRTEKEALERTQKESLERLSLVHQLQLERVREEERIKHPHNPPRSPPTPPKHTGEPDPQKLEATMNDAIERLLNEVEQIEHTHRVSPTNISVKQVRHTSRPLSSASPSPTLDKSNRIDSWNAKFLPTQAVSWPAPQSLAVLKKTPVNSPTEPSKPNTVTATATAMATAIDEDEEALLREIETEISSGKVSLTSLDDL